MIFTIWWSHDHQSWVLEEGTEPPSENPESYSILETFKASDWNEAQRKFYWYHMGESE